MFSTKSLLTILFLSLCSSVGATPVGARDSVPTYKKYGKARRSLWGEKISWGEDFSNISLMYNWKDWQFGAVIFMPFGEYDQGSKLLSKWNTNEEHLRLDFKMFGLMINYNLQWGKQKHGVNKLIDADSSVDKSTAKSR